MQSYWGFFCCFFYLDCVSIVYYREIWNKKTSQGQLINQILMVLNNCNSLMYPKKYQNSTTTHFFKLIIMTIMLRFLKFFLHCNMFICLPKQHFVLFLSFLVLWRAFVLLQLRSLFKLQRNAMLYTSSSCTVCGLCWCGIFRSYLCSTEAISA